ncbi:fructose 1,6-bisphosphatase [Candidatus Bathyarchaeota archaeon]|nr:fructose 1,6-bisphosphatase [Candidatus Bathyarchaeota archaeon]
MSSQIGWLEVLNLCKDRVKDNIRPLFKTLSAPQPDLGIGAGGDPVKLVDLAAEKAIISTLQGNGISFTLISEESGIKEYGKTPSQSYVTVDPIDGTTNLVRGVPFYCSSIAVSYEPTISAVHSALVTDLFHDITYTAMAGKGSYRNGSKIGTSQVMSMEEAVIGLDLNTLKVREIAPQITNLIQNTKHIRHFGANALEICYVADGTTDAFVDIRGKLRTTDMAASYLIAKEAGGVITKPNGSEFDAELSPKTRVAFIVAGNHSIHNTILDYLTAI